MSDGTRLTLAYSILAILLLASLATITVQMRRRRRQKLRRRGIKHHGH